MTMTGDGCQECPVAQASRRAFLRDVGRAAAAALALNALGTPAISLAESVTETSPVQQPGRSRIYEIPRGDSIAVDEANDVILARWQDRVYAFSLKCPHRGSRLEWRPAEQRVFCPKHKGRFRADGSHESGRGARDLDRYAVTREGSSVVVDLDTIRRADQDPEAWRAASIVLTERPVR